MSTTRKKDEEKATTDVTGEATTEGSAAVEAPTFPAKGEAPGSIPDDALTRVDWAPQALTVFGYAPEVVWHALEDGTYYTIDQVRAEIEGFLARPVAE